MSRRDFGPVSAARGAGQATVDQRDLTNISKYQELEMAQSQPLEVQEKKELSPKEEKTVPARYYIPNADIYETEGALLVVMELPGVDKKDLEINLENDVLHIEGRIDFSKYDGLDPLYTE